MAPKLSVRPQIFVCRVSAPSCAAPTL
jgi:hypothetical protein